MRYSRPGIAGASQRASRLSECGGIIPPPRASAPRESDLPTPCGGMFFPGKVGYLQRAGFRKRRPFPPARPASFGERAMSTRPAPTLHDPALCRALTRRLEDLLQRMATPRLRFMEVCGTHTVAIFRGGLRALLPEGVTHLTGPGCPVCVTDDSEVAAFLKLAEQPGVILATIGDLMRVPGPDGLSLKHAQAAGARISVIYSPLDALSLAAAHPQDLVIFLGVGFETTAPATAATILTAEQRGIDNFAVCTCHKLVPPALAALLADAENGIDAFLLPGHVSTVLGPAPYEFIARDWSRPAIIAGFEPADILDGLCRMAAQYVDGNIRVENAYPRAVGEDGNPRARSVVDQVFQVCDASWRGLGRLADSGLALRPSYSRFDALDRLGIRPPAVRPIPGCRCGDVLRGRLAPDACPLFGTACTPSSPVGPCMVSTEGSCAAQYNYGV